MSMLSLLELSKKILASRVGLVVVSFLAGGAITAMFLPEKTIIKKDTEIVYKDRVVTQEVIKYVDREVIKEVKVVEKVRVVKRKETFQDGDIIEAELFESESEQIARVTEQEKERYQASLASMETEYKKRESYLKETLNPHKFGVYAGAGTRIDDPKNFLYVGGMQAQIFGPFMIGTEVTSRKDVALTVGLRF